MAFIPDGGDDPNHLRSGLQPPTVKSTAADFYGQRSYDFLILNSRYPYFPYQRRNHAKLAQRLVRRVRDLGFTVALQSAA